MVFRLIQSTQRNDKRSLQTNGQSLVEFALIIPIVLLLVMGTLDLGRALYVKISLESAAREGAYQYSYTKDATSTKNAIVAEATNLGLSVNPATDITITYPCPSTTNCVEVRVRNQVRLLILNFINGPLQVESTVRMLTE
jgi:hypothetical protein